MLWNQWPNATGMGGRMFMELAAEWGWNMQRNPEKWENADLNSFLEAMAAWIEDMDGFYLNQNRAVPDQPNWKILTEIFLAARVYE